VNGVFQGSEIGVGNNDVPLVPTLIGADLELGSITGRWKGCIDEVRFWSVARSQPEIESTMDAPITGSEPNLIGYWDFDEGTGQTAGDSGPNAIDGILGGTTDPGDDDPQWALSDIPFCSPPTPTASSTPTPTATSTPTETPTPTPTPECGVEGYSLYFDGGDHVLLGTDSRLNPMSEYTIEVWVRPDTVGWRSIFSRYNHYVEAAYHVGTALGNFRFSSEMPFGYVESTVPVNDFWQHVAAVYDSGTITLYVNGVYQDSRGSIGNNSVPFVPTLIGASLENGSIVGNWRGWISEVRFWSVVRPLEEIQDTMHTTITGAEPNLIGYWSFSEGSGQIAHDSSPNGLDGILGATTAPGDDDPQWDPCNVPRFPQTGIPDLFWK
jgi:hypothetical protein